MERIQIRGKVESRSGVVELTLCDHPISVELASNGQEIPILDRLNDPDHYLGPSAFGAVVNFGKIFVREGMVGHVSPDQQWSLSNPPSDGVTMMEFLDLEVADAVREISQIARTNGSCSDTTLCERYHHLNQKVFQAIARHNGSGESHETVALIRAGVVAGQMLEVPVDEQILIHTKRLYLKEQEGKGNIAIGITWVNPEEMSKLNGKIVHIPDPAGATFSSVVANLIYLKQMGVCPKRVEIWNTVASHRGAEFALNAMRDLGIEGQVVAGGYSPGMNDKYYLEESDGGPSVGDAGDMLDRFLPENLRLL